jgi:dolichol-phosphate mannosyltransferase
LRENVRYCVILPAYNEGRYLGTVVGRIPDWIDGIIVVDDASTDDTLAVAQSLPDVRVQIVHLDENQGVGGAMAAGFRVALDAGYDVAIKMDADDQMEVDELPILVRPIELGMAEYVKGNRFRRSGRPAGMPVGRWLGNILLSFFTKVASGYWHVFDPQCGFIAISAPTLRRLKLEGLARDYFFENDMLIRLNVIDARVVDVDTSSLYGDETSHVNIGRVSWSFPPRLARGFIWRFVRRHMMNDFGLIGFLAIVGAAFTMFGLLFGLSGWIESHSTGVPATTGTVMVAVVPLILGVQALLQSVSLEVQSSAGANETREFARMGYSVGKPPTRPD